MYTPTMITRSNDGTETFHFPDSTDLLLNSASLMTKDELESCQVNHYQVSALRYPRLAFELIGPGKNPPDFLIRRNNHIYKLDVAAFSFTDKRSAAVRFRTVIEAVKQAYRSGRLRGLKDLQFLIRFNDGLVPGDVALRVKAIPEFIEFLDSISQRTWSIEDFGSNWVDSVGPGPFPMDQQGETSDGMFSWCVTNVGYLPESNDLIRECGFNIENSSRTTLTLVDISARLTDIVQKHDKEAIEELLIVGGGPDKHGYGYHDEACFAHIFTSQGGRLASKPQHIKRVVIDNWRSKSLDVIFDCNQVGFVE